MLQQYRFKKPDGTEVTVTIEDILHAGVPIDEHGDDLEYLGPVQPYVEDFDPKAHPRDYRVVYAIDIGQADGVHSPEEAARHVAQLLRDPASMQPVLDVICPDGELRRFDLEDDESP